MSNRKSATPDRPENTSTRSNRERIPSLEQIEEAETGLWVEQQLNSIRDFLVEHGADEEMLDVVEFLHEENDDWIDPEVAKDLRSGKLHSGGA